MKKDWLYIALGSLGALGIFFLVRYIVTGKLGRRNRSKIRFVWK